MSDKMTNIGYPDSLAELVSAKVAHYGDLIDTPGQAWAFTGEATDSCFWTLHQRAIALGAIATVVNKKWKEAISRAEKAEAEAERLKKLVAERETEIRKWQMSRTAWGNDLASMRLARDDYFSQLVRCKEMLENTRANIGPCTCSSAYKDRGLTAPDCAYCRSGVGDPEYIALLEEI